MSDVPKNETELRIVQRRSDLKRVMGSPAGRRLIWAWLHDWGLLSPTFTGEALGTTHAEGRRSVACQVLLELQGSTKDEYLLMLQEAMSAAALEEDEADDIVER